MKSGRRPKVVRTEALIVRVVAYREADLVLVLVTRTEGKVSAMVRGGRKSVRRFGGALEPMHGIEVTWEDRGGEMVTLKEARVVRVRAGLVKNLDALEAAGRALRWLRHVCPLRTPEEGAFDAACALLDALDQGQPPAPALARFGVRLLSEVGWGVDFERCVRCGKPCPADKAGAFDAARGGLVCQACGGATRIVGPSVRALGARVHSAQGTDAEWSELLSIIDDVMQAHAGFEDR